MSTYVIDVVNLNSDASCLTSNRWLSILEGGEQSYLFQFLNSYIELGKKVSLGVTGATLSDISTYNSEVIRLLQSETSTFEIILRPFAHDNGLTRTTEGFLYNLKKGKQIIEKLFPEYTRFFLPPEFMLTSEQINTLNSLNIDGTFVCAGRYNIEIQKRIPNFPYKVRGIFDTQTNCIPLDYRLTKSYLDGIHFYNATEWNSMILAEKDRLHFSWRDGESTFFIPDGINREVSWLKNEAHSIKRVFLRDLELHFTPNNEIEDHLYKYYPTHSFSAWMKELRMIGFLNSIRIKEEKLQIFTDQEKAIWLQLINSDILSAVEKKSPLIQILDMQKEKVIDFTIWRSERHVEGLECLYLLECSKEERQQIINKNLNSSFLKKLKARIDHISQNHEEN